jgi:NADH dehydrogenase (ubiquinone) 1 beta subcomplex subunit 10
MSVDATYTFEPVADFDVKSAKDKTLVLPRRDPVKFIEAREQRVRERFVNLAEARLLREELKQCYYREGVNHYQNCRELVQTYLAKIKQHEFGSVAVKDGF